MLIAGTRVLYRTMARGTMHCERCGGDRPYKHRAGMRWVHFLGIPLLAREPTGEHLCCSICGTCYRVELLAVPTVEQMRDALRAGTTAAVLAVLRASEPSGPAARRRGAELIRSTGAADYGEEALSAVLSGTPGAPGSDGADAERRLGPAIERLAVQLDVQARDWFLAKVVRVGLADGPLTAAERKAIGTVARHLGMSRAKAQDVISMTENAAQAGLVAP